MYVCAHHGSFPYQVLCKLVKSKHCEFSVLDLTQYVYISKYKKHVECFFCPSFSAVDLLGCLNWQTILGDNDTASLKQHLYQLMRVDGLEIVKVPGKTLS